MLFFTCSGLEKNRLRTQSAVLDSKILYSPRFKVRITDKLDMYTAHGVFTQHSVPFTVVARRIVRGVLIKLSKLYESDTFMKRAAL